MSFIGIVIWGVFDVRSGYFIKTHCRNLEVKGKMISITFDDGPSIFTEQFLDLLDKYNAKATFFCVGKNIVKAPDVLRRIIRQGHTIGNHTYNHSNRIGFLKKKELIAEILKTDEVVFENVHRRTMLFRPPFGVTNPNIAKALKETGHYVIGWDIRSLDTIIKDEKDIFFRVKKKVRPGAIILFHDTSEKTLHSLERLLHYLNEKNYKIVTVDKLLKINAYEN